MSKRIKKKSKQDVIIVRSQNEIDNYYEIIEEVDIKNNSKTKFYIKIGKSYDTSIKKINVWPMIKQINVDYHQIN